MVKTPDHVVIDRDSPSWRNFAANFKGFSTPTKPPYSRMQRFTVDMPDIPEEHRVSGVPKVYVIQCGDFVKIGHTTNVGTRLRTILASMPFNITVLKIMEGGQPLERSLHKRFTAHRHRDEWFRIEGALADWIASGFTPTPIAAPDGGNT